MMQHDIQKRVVEVIENTINELQVLGMKPENAVELLLIQAAIRMPNAAAIRDALGDNLIDTVD